MSDPYIGEIRMAGFNFAPRNWAFCNGQLIAIAQNTALFSILGTTYGGNGQTSFGLPDLQGRVPIGQGSGPGLTTRTMGERAGVPSVTLITSQIPAHGHTLNSGVLSTQNAAQNVATPTAQAFFGLSGPNQTYVDPPVTPVAFHPAALATYGSSQPHNNMQPYQAVNFIICMFGVFPARN